MRAIPAALRRAGQRAREIASRTGTAVVVMEGGRLVELTGAAWTGEGGVESFVKEGINPWAGVPDATPRVCVVAALSQESCF